MEHGSKVNNVISKKLLRLLTITDYQFHSIANYPITMEGLQYPKIDPEIEELFLAVTENPKSEKTNISENRKCLRPDDAAENSPAMMQFTSHIPLLLHCRLCGMPDHNMVDIFGSEASRKNILSKINICLPVTVRQTDTLPKHVCWSCMEELDRCYRFRQTVAKAEKQLMTFGRLEFIDVAKTERNDETFPRCERGQKDPVETSNKASGIEPSSNISTSSLELGDKTNDPRLRLKPCWVVLSTIPTQCQNRILATSETKSSSVSQLPNTEDFDIEITQNSGTGITIVQPSTCDSERRRSAAENTQGKETELEMGPAIRKRSRPHRQHHRCTKCGKVYKSRQNLSRHYKLHTGEGLHICAYCGQKCVSRADGIRHQRSHTGARPFGCTICGKKFTALRHLKMHEATVHSDKRDYPCSLCDKSFKTFQSKKRHMLVHTDKDQRTMWQCDHCKKFFWHRSTLVKHMKRCEGNYLSNNVITM